MPDATREAQLIALTAKALRPIAADLGITGASRLSKADIVAAIIAAESARDLATVATFDDLRARHVAKDLTMMVNFGGTPPLQQEPKRDNTEVREALTPPKTIQKHSHWALSYPLAKGGDGNVMQGHADYCAAWPHATETSTDRDGVTTVSGHCPRCGYTAPKLSPEFPARKFAAGDRFRIGVGGQWSEVELLGLDPSGGPGYAWSVRITADKVGVENIPASFHVLTLTEDFLSNDYVTKIEAPKPLPTCVRRTRRGVETVVVEDVRDGRVHYRVIDAKAGRTSAPYTMREASFAARFTPTYS